MQGCSKQMTFKVAISQKQIQEQKRNNRRNMVESKPKRELKLNKFTLVFDKIDWERHRDDSRCFKFNKEHKKEGVERTESGIGSSKIIIGPGNRARRRINRNHGERREGNKSKSFNDDLILEVSESQEGRLFSSIWGGVQEGSEHSYSSGAHLINSEEPPVRSSMIENIRFYSEENQVNPRRSPAITSIRELSPGDNYRRMDQDQHSPHQGSQSQKLVLSSHSSRHEILMRDLKSQQSISLITEIHQQGLEYPHIPNTNQEGNDRHLSHQELHRRPQNHQLSQQILRAGANQISEFGVGSKDLAYNRHEPVQHYDEED